MTMILIKGPSGIREVEADIPFRLEPGEAVISNTRAKTKGKSPAMVEELANALGTSAAVAVEMAAKVIGIPKCRTCAERSLVLRHLGNIGVAEAVRLIKETYGRA